MDAYKSGPLPVYQCRWPASCPMLCAGCRQYLYGFCALYQIVFLIILNTNMCKYAFEVCWIFKATMVISNTNFLPAQMSCKMRKPLWLCIMNRPRSAYASSRSNQSFYCRHKDSLSLQLPIEHTVKTQIRLGVCPV